MDAPPDDMEIRVALKETAEQRDGFRAHAETLTAEVLRLREQCGTLQDQLNATERSHTEARSQWAAKLEQAEHEFSDMLTQDDLKTMRLDIVEQTETPWKAKVKALAAELASAREAASAHRREAERARTALDSAAHEHWASAREAEVRRGAETAELRAKLEMAEASRAGHGADEASRAMLDRSRKLQREHSEATVRASKLLEEVEELRRENDGLLALRTELLAAQASLQGELAAQSKLAASEKASQERLASHLQQELDATAAAQQRMHEAALHGEAEMRTLRAQLGRAPRAVDRARRRDLRLSEVQRGSAPCGSRWTGGAEALRREARCKVARRARGGGVEREASAAIAAARDEESSRLKRLEAERSRLNEPSRRRSRSAVNAALPATVRTRCRGSARPQGPQRASRSRARSTTRRGCGSGPTRRRSGSRRRWRSCTRCASSRAKRTRRAASSRRWRRRRRSRRRSCRCSSRTRRRRPTPSRAAARARSRRSPRSSSR